MSVKLYKLKSNPETVVQRTGEFHKVYWAASMFCGYDARWMMARWNPDNVIPLTAEEKKEVEGWRKRFDGV